MKNGWMTERKRAHHRKTSNFTNSFLLVIFKLKTKTFLVFLFAIILSSSALPWSGLVSTLTCFVVHEAVILLWTTLLTSFSDDNGSESDEEKAAESEEEEEEESEPEEDEEHEQIPSNGVHSATSPQAKPVSLNSLRILSHSHRLTQKQPTAERFHSHTSL